MSIEDSQESLINIDENYDSVEMNDVRLPQLK